MKRYNFIQNHLLLNIFQLRLIKLIIRILGMYWRRNAQLFIKALSFLSPLGISCRMIKFILWLGMLGLRISVPLICLMFLLFCMGLKDRMFKWRPTKFSRIDWNTVRTYFSSWKSTKHAYRTTVSTCKYVTRQTA